MRATRQRTILGFLKTPVKSEDLQGNAVDESSLFTSSFTDSSNKHPSTTPMSDESASRCGNYIDSLSVKANEVLYSSSPSNRYILSKSNANDCDDSLNHDLATKELSLHKYTEKEPIMTYVKRHRMTDSNNENEQEIEIGSRSRLKRRVITEDDNYEFSSDLHIDIVENEPNYPGITDATTKKTETHISSSPSVDKMKSLEAMKYIVDDLSPQELNQIQKNDTVEASAESLRSKKAKQFDKDMKFKNFNEERYSWLQDVRDSAGRKLNDPEYDKRSLYIPKSAWATMKPFEKQYWEIKKNCWDTVLFFQKGKFYELYENDASIGHQQFDLKLTDRVNMRMVGVPESGFEHWASQFVAKGYKVARVDQLETALGKEINNRNIRSGEKIVRRELTQVLTVGTLVSERMLTSDLSTYCLALKENQCTYKSTKFGLCWIDTSTGYLYSCTFEDDSERSLLETILAQITPKELVLEKGMIAKSTIKTLQRNCNTTTLWNYFFPNFEFWDAERTRVHFSKSRYFKGSNQMPELLRTVLDDDNAASALGALTYYLKYLKLDEDLFSLGKLFIYDPMKHATSLTMNGQTLKNLDIFWNSSDDTEHGTLFELLNHSSTPFGKRKFRTMVCHPLLDIAEINDRLDAIDVIQENIEQLSLIKDLMCKLPDLERMISRIHSLKCKPRDFVRVLEGFENVNRILEICRNQIGWNSKLLKNLIIDSPKLNINLEEWQSVFNWSIAKESNVIEPAEGIEPDFDRSNQLISKVEYQLNELLLQYKKNFSCTEICFRNIGKEIYQIEVPKHLKKLVPVSWSRLSGTSKCDRYWPNDVRNKVKELQELREMHSQLGRQIENRFYKRFDEKNTTWSQAIHIVSVLDCIFNLVLTTRNLGSKCCRPKFVEAKKQFCEYKGLYLPCNTSVQEFIANDVKLGGEGASIILLTGPNMSGKSTLLKQICIATVMAQLGCYVPANLAELTPFDSIKTRLGACDNILASQSTFMLELHETKKILNESTSRSMVILDELGRGTSTHDGAAIAYAVLHHLATFTRSLGIFSTHYSQLVEDFAAHSEVSTKNMLSLVDEKCRRVTFLYKLVDGVCSSSHGLNVAGMAGIPHCIINQAEAIASKFQEVIDQKKTTQSAQSGKIIAMCSDFAWMYNKTLGQYTEFDLESISILHKIALNL